MTHATRPAHLARATFEAIAHQVVDVFEAMEADIGHRLLAIHADGGASGNSFLMQVQADLAGRVVQASRVEEVGAFGAAAMAMGGMGGSSAFPTSDAGLSEPQLGQDRRQAARAAWRRALGQAMERYPTSGT